MVRLYINVIWESCEFKFVILFIVVLIHKNLCYIIYISELNYSIISISKEMFRLTLHSRYELIRKRVNVQVLITFIHYKSCNTSASHQSITESTTWNVFRGDSFCTRHYRGYDVTSGPNTATCPV